VRNSHHREVCEDHRRWAAWALACELLEVSRSGFYDWQARRSRPATPAEREQQLLVAAITVEHIASKQRYGSPRIHAELIAQGWRVGVNRIARLMRLDGLKGRSGRLRRHNLTRQAKIAPDIPDLLEREQPDTRWVTDTSYVPTAQGWVASRLLVDLCSKAVVGWAADTHMRTSLVLQALTMALTARAPGPGLIVRSDRGSQSCDPASEWQTRPSRRVPRDQRAISSASRTISVRMFDAHRQPTIIRE
jgi:putative transposase